MPFVMSQNCECRVYNRTELNELHRIFVNKGSCEKTFGHLLITSNSSHFFNKTDFEQYFFKENAIVTVRQIVVNLQQARRHGG